MPKAPKATLKSLGKLNLSPSIICVPVIAYFAASPEAVCRAYRAYIVENTKNTTMTTENRSTCLYCPDARMATVSEATISATLLAEVNHSAGAKRYANNTAPATSHGVDALVKTQKRTHAQLMMTTAATRTPSGLSSNDTPPCAKTCPTPPTIPPS